NWIATYLLFFALKTTVFTGANQSQPTSPSIADSATLPVLLGPQFRLHAGLVIAAGSAVLLWWLMSRSTLGFQFRAVGCNPRRAGGRHLPGPRLFLRARRRRGPGGPGRSGARAGHREAPDRRRGRFDRLRRDHRGPAGPVRAPRHHLGRSALRRPVHRGPADG